MNKIPQAIWSVISLAALVAVGAVWLYFHDVRVREGAQAKATIASLDSAYTVVRAERDALVARVREDSIDLARKETTFVRVAYVSPKLRDSLVVLNAVLDSLQHAGASVVPIGLANDLRQKVNACRMQVSTLTGAGMDAQSACDRRVAHLNNVIRDDSILLHNRDSAYKVAANGPRASDARLKFAIDGNEVFEVGHRPRTELEVGPMVRAFGGVHLRAAVRHDSTFTGVAGVHIEFR